jgi:M6 family metalloprotease-like protein
MIRGTFPVLVLLVLIATSGASYASVALAHIQQAAYDIPKIVTSAPSLPLGLAKGSQRIVVVLVEFRDTAHSIDTNRVRDILTIMNDFYSQSSYGLLSLVATVTDRWYQIQTPLSRLDIQKWNYSKNDMDEFRREAINASDIDVDFGDYDYVYVVAAGRVWPNGFLTQVSPTNDGVSQLKLVVINEESDYRSYCHELGHLLPSNYKPWGFGLPDLYSYDAAQRGNDSSIWVGPWDIMDSGLEFSAWSKITLGWVVPENLTLDTATTHVINLQPLEKDSGPRVIIVGLNGTTSYAIEARRKTGSDWALPAEGVLIYLVDSSKNSGYGVLRVYDSKPNTSTLNDAPLGAGDTFEDPHEHIYVIVAETDSVGYTLIISGSKGLDTDGDGLSDWEEVRRYGTSPLRSDTDGDYWKDRMDPAPTNSLIPNLFITAIVILAAVSALAIRRHSSHSGNRGRAAYLVGQQLSVVHLQ